MSQFDYFYYCIACTFCTLVICCENCAFLPEGTVSFGAVEGAEALRDDPNNRCKGARNWEGVVGEFFAAEQWSVVRGVRLRLRAKETLESIE